MYASPIYSPATRLRLEQEQYERDLDAAENDLYDAFMQSVATGDVTATCDWASMVTDWNQPAPLNSGKRPQRRQTLAEVLFDQMEGIDNKQCEKALQILIDAANGLDVRSDARAFIERMAAQYAGEYARA